MNLSCSDCSQSASDRCSSTPPGEEPALLTMMSTRPSALWPCVTKFLASASLLRSAGIGTIRRLVSRAISAAASSSGSLRRAQMATSTPSFASARAMPLPMPALPPVTSAVLPSSLRSMSVSSCDLSSWVRRKPTYARCGNFRHCGFSNAPERDATSLACTQNASRDIARPQAAESSPRFSAVHDRLRRVAYRLDVVVGLEEGDDAAWTTLEALIAPGKRPDQRALVEHELDVATEVLGV